MKIGVAKETTPLEERVILRPHEVREIVSQGHPVSVEKNAGKGVYLTDSDYEAAGAQIIEDRLALYRGVELLVKLKAPTVDEFGMLEGNILLSMLHHQQNPVYVYYLGRQGAVGVEMESIKNSAGERLLDATDMTGEAGVLFAASKMKKTTEDSNVLILGYGRVGSAAIRACNKLGMRAKILRKSEYRHIQHFLEGKDLLINAITWPERSRQDKHYVVTRDMLKLMNRGAVVLDLAVDFPSPIETCRPTSLNNPWYVEDDVIHIGIYGYPGLVPVSCTERYSRQVLPIVLAIADNNGLSGIEGADLGKYIAKAIVDPKKKGWENYAPPETPKCSKTE